MKTLALFLVIAFSMSGSAAAEVLDPTNSYAEILDPYPFTVAPCGGDAMPVIDVYVISYPGGYPVEVIATDIWLGQPDVFFCAQVFADSSTYAPDPGHTTISGAPGMGLSTELDCEAVPVDVIAVGSVIERLDWSVNSPDLTADGEVAVADFALFADRFQGTDPCADYNLDGEVTVVDFGIFAGWFNACVCAF